MRTALTAADIPTKADQSVLSVSNAPGHYVGQTNKTGSQYGNVNDDKYGQ